jgi:Heterokaryon incompatibility protein (HET)
LDLDSSVELSSRWLDECQFNHNKCRGAPRDDKFLPTRLIDVGEPGKNVEPLLYVPDGNEKCPAEHYMTLSHCWGPKEIAEKVPRLLLANLKDRMTQIVTSDLPATFQHAIAITRKLGIRYLWIDSLCIIQDSDEQSDWLRESARMGDVYANSYCNIAATAAKDGTMGCFSERNPILVNPLRIEVSWSGLTAGTYCAIDGDMWDREVDCAPLNQRAWVFQERFLTPRNLSFGARRLFWECQERRACETFPTGLPSCITATQLRVSDATALEKSYTRQTMSKEEEAKYEAVRAWLRLVTGAEMPPIQGGSFKSKHNWHTLQLPFEFY